MSGGRRQRQIPNSDLAGDRQNSSALLAVPSDGAGRFASNMAPGQFVPGQRHVRTLVAEVTARS
jgi:hypothetical protein